MRKKKKRRVCTVYSVSVRVSYSCVTGPGECVLVERRIQFCVGEENGRQLAHSHLSALPQTSRVLWLATKPVAR